MQKHEDERITLLFCQNSMIETKPTYCNGIRKKSHACWQRSVFAVWARVFQARAPHWQVAASHNKARCTGTKTEAAAKQTPRTYTLGLICLCVWGNDDALEKLRSWSNFTTQKKANSTIRNLNNVCTSYYHHQDCSSGFHTSKRTIFAIKVIANTDLYLKSAATKKILLLVGSPVNHFIHNLRKGCMRPCITMKTGVQESLDKQKLLPKFFKSPKDYSTRGLATWFS